jgi:rRNA maturation endonuclease Nob1
MLTYNDHRCEYCGKVISKISQPHDNAEKKVFKPETIYKNPRYSNQNQIECNTCGHEISKKTIQCPSCGEIRYWRLILLIVQIGLFFGIVNLIFYVIMFKIMGF